MSEKYKIKDKSNLYFVTFATSYWIDVFTRPEYKTIVIDSLKHCQKEKGLEVYCWCLMTNHIHLIIGSDGKNRIENIIRDFKKFTSVHICKAIENNPFESRKEWLLWMLKRAAEKTGKHQKYCFWQNEYHPIELFDETMMKQKMEYIHQNPVKESIVNEPWEYLYSSAMDYCVKDAKGLLDLKYLK